MSYRHRRNRCMTHYAPAPRTPLDQPLYKAGKVILSIAWTWRYSKPLKMLSRYWFIVHDAPRSLERLPTNHTAGLTSPEPTCFLLSWHILLSPPPPHSPAYPSQPIKHSAELEKRLGVPREHAEGGRCSGLSGVQCCSEGVHRSGGVGSRGGAPRRHACGGGRARPFYRCEDRSRYFDTGRRGRWSRSGLSGRRRR